VTLLKDCKCPCHRAKHAVIHVVPCCGPGSGEISAKPSPAAKKVKRAKPKLGTLQGRILIHDPDWWKPMTSEEVDESFDTDD
jgi:hypothetical protein